ncbi:NACHT domain-containing protein [Kribbella qitaiheensis]|uniref:NACHT domain-containing protein n=1 Tax=Kribbella qitaiheensis TaxID=1544730 RepID=UPI00162A4356|nr:NACHT domain-containing protein [Kribbella qitaiheensis]
MAIEAAIFSLSQNIMSAAMDVWFSRRRPNQTMAQLIQDQVPNSIERRRLERAFDEMQEVVIDRLMQDTRAQRLPEHEKNAAVLAAADSFRIAALTQQDMLTAAMSPAAVAETVRERSWQVRGNAQLTDLGIQLYDSLVDETSSILVTIVSSLPGWDSRALNYLLHKQEDLGLALAKALDRLPSSISPEPMIDPLISYRQHVVSALDRVETVGFPVSDSVSGLRVSETFIRPDVVVANSRMPLDWALADHRRLFLHGPAGSGKTSILKWLAISSARQSLDGLIASLNDYLPVYIPLRRVFSNSEPPLPDVNSLAQIAYPSFQAEQLPNLVRQRCEAGYLLLLLDGLDEIEASSRLRWLAWLSEMTELYPKCRFVVTSRTALFDLEALVDLKFTTSYLETLQNSSKIQLIRQWFAAAGSVADVWAGSSPTESAAKLVRIIETNSRLNDLAATPLMCTLICALFRERGDLPLVRADVYSQFIDMLVERRDTERGIPGIGSLPKPESLMLLEELAQLMIRDGVSEISREYALEVVELAASSMLRLQLEPSEALNHLLTRSGLLIEPAAGRVQFVHRTLMEFLAARSFVENDRIYLLAEKAHDPAWRSVTVLAASQARPRQGEQLVEEMLSRCYEEPKWRAAVAAVLQESVASMVSLSPSLRERCEALWRQQTDRQTPQALLSLDAGTPSDLTSLYEWLAGDDGISRFGSTLISRVPGGEGRPRLVMAGDEPLNLGRVVQSVLDWRRARLPGREFGVLIEDGKSRIVVDFSDASVRDLGGYHSW